MKLNTPKTGALAALCTMVLLMAAAPGANAQDPRRGYNVGVGAQGTDMWTQAMSGLRLFTPHRDNCNSSTEAFIKIYTNSNNVDFGFCMDKDEHSAGALEFEEARQECIDDGKRLPEPVEFKVACENSGTLSLNNMTDDAEWATNFAVILWQASSSQPVGVSAVTAGASQCYVIGAGWVGRSSGAIPTRAFRCVR